jgi:hypothetical protein
MGIVHIPWYATGLRAGKMAAGLSGIAPIALRYGARSYEVHQFRDDLYKFLQTAEFDTKLDFERYWNGPEFVDFRVLASSWYQVPVLYGWSDLVAAGALESEEAVHSSHGLADAAPTGDLAG